MPWTLNNSQAPSRLDPLVLRRDLTISHKKTERLAKVYQIIQENQGKAEMLVAVCDELADFDNLSEHQNWLSHMLAYADKAGFPDSLQTLVAVIAKKIPCEENQFNFAKIVRFLMCQINDKKQTSPQKLAKANELIDSLSEESANKIESGKSLEPKNLNVFQKNAYHLAQKIILSQGNPSLSQEKNYFSKVLNSLEKTEGSLFFSCQKYAVSLAPQGVLSVTPARAPSQGQTSQEILNDIKTIRLLLLSQKENQGTHLNAFFGVLALELDEWFDVHSQDPTHGTWVKKVISRKIEDKESYLNTYFDVIHQNKVEKIKQSYEKVIQKIKEIRKNKALISALSTHDNMVNFVSEHKDLFESRLKLEDELHVEWEALLQVLPQNPANTRFIQSIQDELTRWKRVDLETKKDLIRIEIHQKYSPSLTYSYPEWPLDLLTLESQLNSLHMVPEKDPLQVQIQSTLQDIRSLKNEDPAQAKNLMEEILDVIKDSGKGISEKPPLEFYETLQKEMTDFEFSIRKQKELLPRYDKMISHHCPTVGEKQKKDLFSFLISEKELRILEWYTQGAKNLFSQFKQRVSSYYRSWHKKDLKKSPLSGRIYPLDDGAQLLDRPSLSKFYETRFNVDLKGYSSYIVPFITKPVLKIIQGSLRFIHVDFSGFQHQYTQQHVICAGVVFKKDGDGKEQRRDVFVPVYFDGNGAPHTKRYLDEIDKFTTEVKNWSSDFGLDFNKAQNLKIQVLKWKQWLGEGEQSTDAVPWHINQQLRWNPLLRAIYEGKEKSRFQLQEVLERCDKEYTNHHLHQETLSLLKHLRKPLVPVAAR